MAVGEKGVRKVSLVETAQGRDPPKHSGSKLCLERNFLTVISYGVLA